MIDSLIATQLFVIILFIFTTNEGSFRILKAYPSSVWIYNDAFPPSRASSLIKHTNIQTHPSRSKSKSKSILPINFPISHKQTTINFLSKYTYTYSPLYHLYLHKVSKMDAFHIPSPNPARPDADDASNEFRHMDKVDPLKQYKFEEPLPVRPGWNTDGKQILVRVNQFKVLNWPDKCIYQYDVSVSISSTIIEILKLKIPQR